MALQGGIAAKTGKRHAAPTRRALLVAGARQVGKAFAIRAYIQERYESPLEIDFIETHVKSIFGAMPSEIIGSSKRVICVRSRTGRHACHAP